MKSTATLSPGMRLGSYEIVALLGAGGMGEVYRAKDVRLGRTVAIKVLPAHLSEDPERRQRLEREARAVSSLNHPNICTLHDIGRQDGIDFLVMEYLEGETLAECLKKGPLPLDQFFRHAIEIANALDRAHREGITHRDLKPGNIFLTASGSKLLDFGLAKSRKESVSAAGAITELATDTLRVTTQGSILGTIPYMSPEQLEGKEADARSDLFALGAVLYEMVTGKPAFQGSSSASLIAAILSSEPPPMTQRQPAAPPALERLVRNCLAKNPNDRWQSAHDVKLELEGIREGMADRPTSGLQSHQGTRREKLGWALAAVFLVCAVSLLIWSPFKPTSEPQQMYRSLLSPPQAAFFAPYYFAVSPDGTRLAFVAIAPDGRSSLWVRPLDSSAAQQLAGTDGASNPFWAPESNRIGFFAEGKLKIAEAGGGAVQIISEAPTGRGGSWNREGTILFAPRVGPLYRVASTGGTPIEVTRLDRDGSGQAHRWPFFLPDGKHFFYFLDWSTSAATHGNGIYVGSLDGGEPRLISSDLAGKVCFGSGYLLYVQGRSLMAQPFDVDRLQTTGPAVPIIKQEIEPDPVFFEAGFSVSQNGLVVFQSESDSPSRLIWLDGKGKELDQIAERGLRDTRLSPDGHFLAVSADDFRNGQFFIRVHDLARGISTRLTSSGHETNPIWTPDGTRIVYVSTQGRTSYLYQTAADGSGAPEVLVQGPKMFPNDFTRDGRYLAYMKFEKGAPSLWIYDTEEHKSREELAFGAEAQFSPDGNWLAYTARGIIVQAFPGPGPRIQVASQGSQARWSRDGNRLFYMAPDRKMMQVFVERRGNSLVASPPTALFQTRIIRTNYAPWQYDVAPDGNRFIINSLDPASPLTLLTNWTAKLRR